MGRIPEEAEQHPCLWVTIKGEYFNCASIVIMLMINLTKSLNVCIHITSSVR